jgi:cytochrome c oxidase subunit II
MKAQRYLFALVVFFVIPILIFTLTPSFSFAGQPEQVIKITAKKFEYSPSEIRVKKGVPVVLELTSLDRLHGFNCPELGIRSDVNPGQIARVRFTPQKSGTFVFFCDVFCGEGHEDMSGKIIVED